MRMAALLALVAIAAVAFLVVRLRPGTDADAPFADVPEDDGGEWVTLRGSVPTSEATVIRALLESHGIRVSMEARGANAWLAMTQPRGNGPFRLRVAERDLEEAEALLS